jgi:hypothetical protein
VPEFTPPLNITEIEVEEGIAIIDQALTDVTNGLVTGRDVGAALNVIGCPEVKCFCEIAFVKKPVKSFQNNGLVLFFL